MACRWAEYSSGTSQTSTTSCTSASAVTTTRDVPSASIGTVVAPSGPVLEGPRTTGYFAATERVSDSEEDDAAWGRPKRPSNLPVVTVERSTPHVAVSSDVTARAAAAAGLLVPVDDNGNPFDECCVRSYGSRYLCLKYLLALWWS